MTEQDLLPPVRYGSEVEREAVGPARSIGGSLVVGGLLGAVMSVQEPGLRLRERVVAGAASAITIGIGALVVLDPPRFMVPARRQPERSAAAGYCLVVGSVVAGGGHRTPAYFPGVLLTAVSAGLAGDSRRGPVAGGTVGAAYLAGCLMSRRRLGETWERRAWWNVAGALGFVTAGQVGGVAGELSLLARSLSDYTARESWARGWGGDKASVQRHVDTLRQQAEAFRALLPDVERWFADDVRLRHATGDIATALASLRSAELRHATAIASEQRDLWPQLEQLAQNHNRRPGDVEVSLFCDAPGPPQTDAASTSAMIVSAVALIQNAGEARRGRDLPVQVSVRLLVVEEADGPWLRLTVEDDAGGGEIPADEWGGGLSDCEASAHRLGGTFRLEAGSTGVRATMSVPYVLGSGLGAHASTLTGEFTKSRDRAVTALRRTTAAQGVFILLSQTAVRDMPVQLARWFLLVGAGELTEKLGEEAQAPAQAALAVLAMAAFPGPEQPPLGGWSAVMCASTASRGHGLWSAAAGAAAVASAVAVAGPQRFGEALPVTIGDRTFPLVGVGGGIGVGRGIARFAAQEDAVASEAWQRTLLEDMVAVVRDLHHFIGPLRAAVGDRRWEQFLRSDLGHRFEAVAGDSLSGARETLEDHLRQGDPLELMQHQIARLLAPALVRVHGCRPEVTPGRRGQDLDPVRYRVGLIGLGETIARRIRAQLPTRRLARAELREVQLRILPETYGALAEVNVVQIPFVARQEDRLDAELDLASRRAGGHAGVPLSGSFSTFVHKSALR